MEETNEDDIQNSNGSHGSCFDAPCRFTVAINATCA
jgi:hypothetical protein